MVISAIEGMAGVGKTQLAIHAGHLLAREQPFDRVLFVNLRGFHPDPAQPPADPAAVLDGFLRLLGVPGQQIPHDLAARTAAYRDRLAGTRTLVVLDNAADAEQVRPLLPATPGCLTLVTSRRSLTDLQPATHLDRGRVHPRRGRGLPDPGRTRGSRRHGSARRGPDRPTLRLPAAGPRPGRRAHPRHTRLDADRPRRPARRTPPPPAPGHRRRTRPRPVLPAPARRPATAAAPGWRCTPVRTSTPTPPPPWPTPTCPPPRTSLHHLCRDHLLQQATPGRYTFHDLVRAYATDRASDEDPPPRAPRRPDPPVRLLPGHRRDRHGRGLPA